MRKKELKTIGWKEWVSIPGLGIDVVEAKVDTGARTSSLHAYDLKTYKRGVSEFVKFKFSPRRKDPANEIECHAKILGYKKVKSSNGLSELRPVIRTSVMLLGDKWEIELTLANRGKMRFKMLLGREAIRRKFLVNPGRVFLAGKEGVAK